MSNHIELNEKEDPDANNQPSARQFNESNIIVLPKSKRWIIYALLISISTLSNIDHGTIPAATAQIKEDLNISDTILGLFGSAVYAGTIIGAILCISLINLVNRKYMVIASIICTGACLIIFTIKQSYILLFINRGIVGIFQTYLAIYFPVWCDQFGIENKKTIMLALIQVGSPVGIVFGYALTTLFSGNVGWKMSFIVEAVINIAISIGLFFFPNDYFSPSLRKDMSILNKDDSDFYDENLLQITEEEKLQKAQDTEGKKLLRQFKKILTEPIFILSVLELSSLLYIATCIQYWASDYMMVTLGVEDETQRLIGFVIVCLSSPTLGVILGGVIISCFGGYESKHSTTICSIFIIFLAFSTIPIPLVNSLVPFTIFLWVVLFFGGAIIASFNGIIITSVPKEYAGSANSISHLVYNLLGKLPAPYIYGAIKTNVSGRVAMMVSMWISAIAAILMFLTAWIRFKNYGRIQQYAMVSPNTNTNPDVREIELTPAKENNEEKAPEVKLDAEPVV